MRIRINIFIEGIEDQIGFRSWSVIPRVGEEMVVTLKDVNCILPIKKVIWGVTQASRESDDAEVSIELESLQK